MLRHIIAVALMKPAYIEGDDLVVDTYYGLDVWDVKEVDRLCIPRNHDTILGLILKSGATKWIVPLTTKERDDVFALIKKYFYDRDKSVVIEFTMAVLPC